MSKNENEPVVSESLAPGKTLRAARERANMSLQDVSVATRIAEPRLMALESDDYDNVGVSAAFVLGYIRAYARLVDIDADPLIQSMDVYVKACAAAAEESDIQATSEKPALSRRSGPGHFLKWVGLAIMLLVSWGLIHLTLNSGGNEDSVRQRENPVSAIVGTIDATIGLDNDVSNTAVGESAGNTVKTVKINRIATTESVSKEQTQLTALKIETAESGDLSDAEPGQAVLPAPSGRLLLEPEVSVVTGVEVTEVAEIEELVEANSSPALSGQAVIPLDGSDDELSGAAAPAETQLPVGTDTLVISFTDDCWLEVRDAYGQVMDIRLAKRGSVFEALGTAPFDLKFGNANVVDVIVNERAIVLSPRPGRNTLRIKAGP